MAKSLDLSSYKKKDTSKTQVKHNKYTSYLENELATPKKLSKEDSKRINMAFTDENYEVVCSEANRMGINLVSFINALIEIIPTDDINSYINAMPIKRTKDNVARRKGNPAKRINLKFSNENHLKITYEAELHNQTVTQYVNIIIEVYAQENNN